MHSKTANGVNVADEFSFGKLPDMPKAARGRTSEPLDAGVVELIAQRIPAGSEAENAIVGSQLYTATVAELTEYNKDNANPITSLAALAKRFAFNASATMRKHAAVVAAKRGLTVGARCVNEGTEDRPMLRWYVVITKPRPRAANPVDPAETLTA